MAIAASAPAHMWFVKTGGEVWGPYPQARVAAFAREGRVRPTTLLSPFAQGPWAPAADSVEFADLLRPAAAAAPAKESGAPARRLDTDIVTRSRPPPLAPAPAPSPPPASARDAAGGPERSILVFADLASVAPASFQAGLARFGRCAPVRPGLWLLRAPMTAAALRNLLSSHLGAGDALLVIEAPLDQAAWFNLAPTQDRELRRLWSGG